MRRGADSSLSLFSLYEGDTRVFQVQKISAARREVDKYFRERPTTASYMIYFNEIHVSRKNFIRLRYLMMVMVISLELEKTRDFLFQDDTAFSHKIIPRPILFLFILFHLSLSRS